MAQREELEARIREQRLAEANKKGLMGASGKIGTVLRAMGSPIVGQIQGSLPPMAWEEVDERNDIPTMDIEGAERPSGPEWSEHADHLESFSTYKMGMHFDGLSRGMHLEIIYKDETSEIIVYHKGFLVYKESQGELECYVPSEEWEGWVAGLFKVAKKIQREEKELEFKRTMEEAKKNKASWLSEMASKWGIT